MVIKVFKVDMENDRTMALNKINKPESLAKKVQKALRQSILNNELTPNVIYNEKQIAKDLEFRERLSEKPCWNCQPNAW